MDIANFKNRKGDGSYLYIKDFVIIYKQLPGKDQWRKK